MLAILRSALFMLWMAVTVVPIALVAVVASIFVRGDPLYWICIFFLRLSVAGARVIVRGRTALSEGDVKKVVDKARRVL